MISNNLSSASSCTSSERRSGVFDFLPCVVWPLASTPWQTAHLVLKISLPLSLIVPIASDRLGEKSISEGAVINTAETNGLILIQETAILHLCDRLFQVTVTLALLYVNEAHLKGVIALLWSRATLCILVLEFGYDPKLLVEPCIHICSNPFRFIVHAVTCRVEPVVTNSCCCKLVNGHNSLSKSAFARECFSRRKMITPALNTSQ